MTSNQQINAVLPSDEIEENYLYYQLVYTAPQVKQKAGEQAVPLVNKTQFGEHSILVPESKAEQTAIANVLSDMDTELDVLQQRLSKTQKIKQGMMQELLTGKTRLV
jgi:type I restriction enzyme S subunit